MRTTQELFSLAGKTALITGGSRGLGLQMAEALGEQGARVVLSARSRMSSTKRSPICRRAASTPQPSPPTWPSMHRSSPSSTRR